jgi:hypothetical protein
MLLVRDPVLSADALIPQTGKKPVTPNAPPNDRVRFKVMRLMLSI